MAFRLIAPTITNRSISQFRDFNFYDETFRIVFDSDIARSFYYRVPMNYRVPLQNTNLASLLDKVAKDNGFDWYVGVRDGSGNVKEIVLKILPRTNSDAKVFGTGDDNPVYKFLNERKDRLISFDVGRELRTEPNDVMVNGDNMRTLNESSERNYNGQREVFPIFSEQKDGELNDRFFVPFDNIQGSDTGLVSGLPYVNFEKKNLVTSLGEESSDGQGNPFIPYPNYTFSRPTKSRPGYMATEEIFRAALHGKEAWSTTVWYYYFDAYNIKNRAYNAYDSGQQGTPLPLGRTGGNSQGDIIVGTGIPRSMGIYFPGYDRANPDNPYKARASALGGSTYPTNNAESVAALQEGCYQATIKCATNYYGKVFTVVLPYSNLYDGNLAGVKDALYRNSDKYILPEYDITDGAPALFDLQWYIEATVPYQIKYNQNRAFTTNKAILKPLMLINHYQDYFKAHGYDYVSYELFNEINSVKVPYNSYGSDHR